MRSDVRYTPTDCFYNFPFPQNPTTEAKQQSESIGAFYHNHRQQVMHKRQMGLTAIYNLTVRLNLRPILGIIGKPTIDSSREAAKG